MKRLLVLAASVLLAVLVVGLVVAQDAPKPEPKYYAVFTVGVVLKTDPDEKTALAFLDKASGVVPEMNYTHRAWHPGSESEARKSRYADDAWREAENKPKNTKPLTSYERHSQYSIAPDKPFDLASIHRVHAALSAILEQDCCESGDIIVRVRNTPQRF
jgi:hypothetical protein